MSFFVIPADPGSGPGQAPESRNTWDFWTPVTLSRRKPGAGGTAQMTSWEAINVSWRMNMDVNLKEYFEKAKGTGVLATADREGLVDTAIYAKPHIMDKETVALIMAERLTHHNLQTNNHAAYLFKEDGPGYKGIRLFLTKLREEKDSDLLYSIRSKRYAGGKEEGKPRFLVFFKVDKILPLLGAGRDPEQD